MFGHRYFGASYFGPRFFGPAGAGDATAAGDVIVVTTSVISGHASGAGAGRGGFRRRRLDVLAPTVFPPSTIVIEDGHALGQLLVVHAELIPGKASGGITARGAVLGSSTELIAGRANGSAIQPGALIELNPRLVRVGRAMGVDTYALDDEFLLDAA